jgi:Na+-driven multidrug efflux pump
MWGALLRGALALLFIPLLGAVLGRPLAHMVDFIVAGSATKQDLLPAMLVAVSDNWVLVGGIAIFVAVLAAAIAEARSPTGGI